MEQRDWRCLEVVGIEEEVVGGWRDGNREVMRRVVERNDSRLERTLKIRMLDLRSEVGSLVVLMGLERCTDLL